MKSKIIGMLVRRYHQEVRFWLEVGRAVLFAIAQGITFKEVDDE